MRLLPAALASAALLGAVPAAAQVSNHGIAVESGLSAVLARGAGLGATFAASASTWLEGDVEAVLRFSRGSAAETGGRAAVPFATGTLGLRLSLGHAPVRPQIFLDAGWARLGSGGTASDRVAFGAGAALEWFAAGDLSIAPRAALRVAGGEASLEVTLAFGGYF